MKAKQLVTAGLALAALMACNKEKAVETPLQDGDAYINVKITYSDPATKGTAATPPFYFGTADEQAINNAYFVFYYADGSYDQYVKKENAELTFNPNGTNSSTTENVEELSEAVVVLRNLKSNLYPAFMSVILNSTDEWINGNIKNKSITEAKSAVQAAIATVGTNAQVDWSNFMMSSSTFNNGDERTGYFCTKLTPANFQESAVKAVQSGNPVEAYVERLAAKVKVEFGGTLNINGGKIGTFEVNGAAKDLYFKVKGWGLNATTKNSFCFKNINTSWNSTGLGFDWNDANNHRSYWTQSTNYDNGVYPNTFDSSTGHYKDATDVTLNYISYNSLAVGIGANAYCRENTNTETVMKKNLSSTATSVLLGAQIVDKDGNVLTLYNYNGKLYADETSYKNAALNDYEAKNTDKIFWKKTTGTSGETYTKVSVDDLKVEPSADGYAHVELKVADNYYYGSRSAVESSSATAVTTDDANKMLNGTTQYKYNTGCSFYKNGEMYYNIPIEHLRQSNKTAEGYEVKEGDYGVVRNHYYIVTINSIRNLGKAVNDPDEVIVPNDEDIKSYYVAAKINVLSWKVVNQSVDL